MGGTGKNNRRPDPNPGESNKTPPAPVEDDEPEDGDMATPKRDREGEDDQPL